MSGHEMLRWAWTMVGVAAAVMLVTPERVSADAFQQADPIACVENDCGEQCQLALDTARRFTAKYHSEERAFADGYIREDICVALEGAGAMGYHYPKPALMDDTELDPRFPEVLLYAERPNGARVLIGLEYFVPVLSGGAPWTGNENEPPTVVDNPPPVLFGHTFQGPMPGHAPGMPWHYDLHVWAWRHNPAGTFAVWNPKVSCP